VSVPVVRSKDGVTFKMGPPAGFRILGALANLAFYLWSDVTITSGSDGNRLPTDPHATGEAIDIRTTDWDDETIKRALLWLRQDLGPLFTVLHERPVDVASGPLVGLVTVNANASGQHIHAQRKRDTVYPPV